MRNEYLHQNKRMQPKRMGSNTSPATQLQIPPRANSTSFSLDSVKQSRNKSRTFSCKSNKGNKNHQYQFIGKHMQVFDSNHTSEQQLHWNTPHWHIHTVRRYPKLKGSYAKLARCATTCSFASEEIKEISKMQYDYRIEGFINRKL
jgi:hypothetical protein